MISASQQQQQQLDALKQHLQQVVRLNREALKQRESRSQLLRQWSQS